MKLNQQKISKLLSLWEHEPDAIPNLRKLSTKELSEFILEHQPKIKHELKDSNTDKLIAIIFHLDNQNLIKWPSFWILVYPNDYQKINGQWVPRKIDDEISEDETYYDYSSSLEGET